ncbi:PEP/pyruvate-binding domain-containing protein [Nocardioides sp. LMS-CY]|uniref:PEP/pyruvate-binding domain-containing protein n=1 Tax=Nocardioides sp. (strain LMS-CY) TaxID=2840457 RepID=UPI001C002302|nr:PEP/pyruvate-binding domain-containing protein [Nocardioides sp. LMS-CY]QWF22399.1 PEP/pyruvate-binding domain-containing protein [Nocardioides sp. LMS-CY]
MSVMTESSLDYTLDFTHERARLVAEVGGKGAGLAEMTAAGLPVAPGFVVTASAYREYLDTDGLRADIEALLAPVRDGDHASYDVAERAIAQRLAEAPLPAAVAVQVREQYAALCARVGMADVPVAVRSSATAEDSAADSFAGEFETWVDVVGADEVLRHVHRCYVSVFTGRVLAYALERGIDLATVDMAVVVQKTVRARAAGVMFTLDPITGDRSRIVLEASWGLGLAVVGGEVNPDRFTVAKVGLAIAERVVSSKHVEYRTGHASVEVPAERRDVLCLGDDEVVALATLAKQVERMNGCPQDIEFAVDEDLAAGENLVLLQCRPETVWSTVERKPAFDTGASVVSWITGTIAGSGSVPTDGHQHG